MTEPTANNRRRWFRFSLRPILTLAVILTLGVAHLIKSRELQATKTALAELRSNLGEISIGDPSKTHVYSRPTDIDDEWCWRLYVPPGAKYKLLVEDESIYPSSGGQTVRQVTDTQRNPSDCLDAGLYTIHFHQRQVPTRRSDTSSWTWAIHFLSDDASGRVTGGFGPTWTAPGALPWAEEGWHRQTRVYAEDVTVSTAPTETIALFELRCVPPESSPTLVNEVKPSLLVHLVPVTTP